VPVPGVQAEAGPKLPLRCLKALSPEPHCGVRSGLSSPHLARATSHFCLHLPCGPRPFSLQVSALSLGLL
jgi:hypothetical protein